MADVPNSDVVPETTKVPPTTAAVESKAVEPVKTEVPAPEAKADAKPEVKAETSILGEAKVEAKTEAKTETTAPVEIKLEIPKDSGMTEAQVQAIATLAKEQGFTQAQAQKLVEREAAQTVSNKNAYAKTFESWKAESVKQFGDKLPEMTESAKRFLRSDAVTDAERALVRETPYGNHPFMIKLLAKLGEGLKEDVAPSGTQAPPKQKSVVDRFYPKGHATPSVSH